jgi:hypothetical protein
MPPVFKSGTEAFRYRTGSSIYFIKYYVIGDLMFQLDVFRESTLVQKTELLFQSRAPRLGNSSNILDSCALTPLLFPSLF